MASENESIIIETKEYSNSTSFIIEGVGLKYVFDFTQNDLAAITIYRTKGIMTMEEVQMFLFLSGDQNWAILESCEASTMFVSANYQALYSRVKGDSFLSIRVMVPLLKF